MKEKKMGKHTDHQANRPVEKPIEKPVEKPAPVVSEKPAESAKSDKKPILIKKYQNRRLYNTEESRHMTLEEIATLIRAGNEIKVLDSQNDQDITKQILAQIILEEEKNQKDMLPVALLYQIIRASEEMNRDFFENYLNSMFESYIAHRRLVEKRLHEMRDMSKLPFELGDLFMKSFGVSNPLGGKTRKPEKDNPQ